MVKYESTVIWIHSYATSVLMDAKGVWLGWNLITLSRFSVCTLLTLTCETFLGQYLDHGHFDITLDKVLTTTWVPHSFPARYKSPIISLAYPCSSELLLLLPCSFSALIVSIWIKSCSYEREHVTDILLMNKICSREEKKHHCYRTI